VFKHSSPVGRDATIGAFSLVVYVAIFESLNQRATISDVTHSAIVNTVVQQITLRTINNITLVPPRFDSEAK
jgi:riboflavin transporter FmnP